MTAVGIEQAKAGLVELLARAAPGEEVLITDGDKPLGVLSAPPAANPCPEVGTPDWDRMNRRRGELIHKKNRDGLSPDELGEYEQLQRLSQTALADKFPRPAQLFKEVTALEARLAAGRQAPNSS